ncbi:hypothetical protein NAU58_07325 [Pseudomonas stutzeri]|uniref:Uncharacterized protein n=1 Tax=Stutzerimonas stutzeri TaxID=316 RepID=A0A2N8S083_STUST|nr:hypothetical protein [Stutzerimonas stutzeri]MCQ4295382.1 hypothetical protein [Stutzerimonas stutzeri]PNF80035.1 hypothetical protein CXK92_15585 [Stutzerimonas stutzeri]
MATITSIQVANFLSDGYTEGREWVPLYRGETFRLFGRSSALQIDNGGGKTSLTESSLFLLSRDARLKAKVADRIAPAEHGWTHIRMEFVEKPHDEDILQRDLITVDPSEIPGVTYVIGLAWSRGKDPYFYHYLGLLSDAPCFVQEPDKLRLIDNETFRRSVERIQGARWDKWRNQKDWLEEIRQFTNIEVVKKNVEFQLEGAGDYSAMINKVEPESGESYDAAFFRQFVAPELLRQSMGTEGDEDEEHFEDTLYKTLKPTADALVHINLRQHELNDAEAALDKFEPVEAKARDVLEANASYEDELSEVIRDAAVVHVLSVRDPIPGMPTIPRDAPWRKDSKLSAVIASLVIDKTAGVLIADHGVAKLLGIETKRVNERAMAVRVSPVVCGAQVVDFTNDFKGMVVAAPDAQYGDEGAYLVENKGDLKESRRGQHRKYAVNGYTLTGAKALLPAGDPGNLADLLTRAFGIAIDIIDTNPYRRTQRELSAQLEKASSSHKTADAGVKQWSAEYENLIAESREAEENQVAYETFAARADLFPAEHKNQPRAAKEWGSKQLTWDRQALSDHNDRVASLTGKHEIWQAVTTKYQDCPLSEALSMIVDRHTEAVAAGEAAKDAMDQACRRRDELRPRHKAAADQLNTAVAAHQRLSELASALPVFRELFGDVDPLQQNPQGNLETTNGQLQSVTERLRAAVETRDKLDNLQPKVKVFHEVFGEAAPNTLNPIQDLINLKGKIATEETILSEHLPYVKALLQFREAHGEETPEQRLEAIERLRGELLGERVAIKRRLEEIGAERKELDAYAVADGRVYSAALDALANAGVSFTRLHTLAMAAPESRREAVLSLFSAALSAPVVQSAEDADKATEVLEKAKLTVPVFLAGPLRQFVEAGSYEVTGEVTHTFLAGRSTRQVKILLNPALIVEEKERLVSEEKSLESRDAEATARLASIDPASEAVAMILRARDAVRKASDTKYAEAKQNLGELSKQLPQQQRKVDAMDTIAAAKEYQALGGETRWQKLVDQTIPHEEGEVARLKRDIRRLQRLVEEDASRALIAAKDFFRSGGEGALARAKADVEQLESMTTDLFKQLEVLRSEIEGKLAENQRSAAAALNSLDQTFHLDKRDLETSIAFEEDGSAHFMSEAEEQLKTLQGAVSTSIARLQDIDFERAHRYIEASKAEGLALADRIAEAKGKRDTFTEQRNTAERSINDLNGRLSALEPFLYDLHDAIVEIREQYGKIVTFSDDVRARIAMEAKAHPDILADAEVLRNGCIGKLPSTSVETKAAIANLREAIKALEIDTRLLNQRRQARAAAQNAFVDERERFCEQARTGHIKGLQLPEIERIAEATTLAQLGAIHHIREKIRATIDEYVDKLTKMRETMETNKAATVDSLVRFARQAEMNLRILSDVMARTPNARFFVEAEVADEETIRRIIESLIIEIQDREQAARDRNPVALNKDIERRNKSYKAEIHKQIYANIFSKERVHFTHAAIWDGMKSPLSGEGGGLSTGQRTALMMMWLIKQAEYSLTRAALMYGSRKQQKAALKSAQRIMFFDGLFSNLSNEDYIDHAFQGLKDVDENFQLIGLIHNPHYVNNQNIFPIHLVGKKKVGVKGGVRRRFVTVEPWQDDNGMITYTSAFREGSAGEDYPRA